jgi:hypothetical protein
METQWMMNIKLLTSCLPLQKFGNWCKDGVNNSLVVLSSVLLYKSVDTFTRNAISSLLFQGWDSYEKSNLQNTPHINIMMHGDGPSKGRQTRGRRYSGTPATFVDPRIAVNTLPC